jgi:hypothetical protein
MIGAGRVEFSSLALFIRIRKVDPDANLNLAFGSYLLLWIRIALQSMFKRLKWTCFVTN